jgi:large subunit ribosomal protein L1
MSQKINNYTKNQLLINEIFPLSLKNKELDFNVIYDYLNKFPKRNFDESIDVTINLKRIKNKVPQSVKHSVKLPNGSGKNVKIAVFANDEQAKIAIDAGADKVGLEDLANDIKNGIIEFDVLLAAPDTMKLVLPLGKILGPKGLMPNPKLGTVTDDFKFMIEEIKNGLIYYKSDKYGIIHCKLGKLSFSQDQLLMNLDAFIKNVKSHNYIIKNIMISASMGPSMYLNMNLIN